MYARQTVSSLTDTQSYVNLFTDSVLISYYQQEPNFSKMSLTIKASLYRHDWRREPVEIRRFTIDAEVATNYSYLVQKLTQVFPALREDNITTTVAWKG